MRNLILLTTSLVLAACGGSGGSDGSPGGGTPPPPPPPPSLSVAESYQFLNQTSFGATPASSTEVINLGIDAWIDQQIATPASLQLPYLQSLPRPMPVGLLNRDRSDIWFEHAVTAPDQLRQRVAFALSEILVVSQQGALQQAPYALADYYDMLAQNAFGNYRDLLERVTLHPAMGVYLSMLGNERPNPALNIRPDENYARELMQLFSIGLIELNIDGTPVLDTNNQPVPTYDQAVIEGFAHVFTGWNWAGAPSFETARQNDFNQTIPMQLYPAFHDTGEKLLLNGVTLPAGQSGQQDLEGALDNIFSHPNVGPFVAIRLIQRLTTSNPSPGYVQRVAETFNDNGSGVRGDLAAVVRAILTDPEARPDIAMDLDGKLKEPLLRLVQVWRAYGAQSASGKYRLDGASFIFGQGPLQSPSVFNFFSPFYAPPGEIANSNLVAPEMQIATEYQNTFITNYFFYQAFFLNQLNTSELGEDDVYIDFSEEIAIAGDATALVDLVADKLLGGVISDTLRNELIATIETIGTEDAALRAAEAIYIIATSPEFATQR